MKTTQNLAGYEIIFSVRESNSEYSVQLRKSTNRRHHYYIELSLAP